MPWPPGLDTPVLSPILVATLGQELTKVIAGTNFCATMAVDDSATMTYVIWREEYIWNYLEKT
jgi:hypothetical protein